jgi:hypothetical protein
MVPLTVESPRTTQTDCKSQLVNINFAAHVLGAIWSSNLSTQMYRGLKRHGEVFHNAALKGIFAHIRSSHSGR